MAIDERRYTTLIPPTHLGCLGYQNFTILKDERLGQGAYGSVYRAMYDDLPCAAKVLHPTLVDGESGKLVKRFERECEMLSKIKHPNIVLYLGLRTDPESRQPVLLMELLHESLTKMLQHSKNALPYDVQVDISHDISLAFAYLHSHNIIHRDLSSNNVLISAKRIAKVSDFGLACIADHLDSHSLTEYPGTKHYMPPEALTDSPTYTELVDIFSLGVIIIQVLTRLLPNPSPKTKILTQCSQLQSHRRYQVVVPECERRQEHINLIHPPSHPLLTISLQCIKDDPKQRPQASKLSRKFIELKQSSKYVESWQSDSDIARQPESCVCETDRSEHLATQTKKPLQGREENMSRLCQQLSEQEKLLSANLKEIQEKQVALTKCAQEIQNLQTENRNLTALLQWKESQLLQSNNALQAAKETCRLQIEAKKELTQKCDQEIARLRETNRIIIDERERESQEANALLSMKEAQIVDLNKMLRKSEQHMTDHQSSTSNLHQHHQLTSLVQPHQRKQSSSSSSSSVNHETKTSNLDKQCGLKEFPQVILKSHSTAPISMYRGATAIYNSVVYFTCKEKVLSYNIQSQAWATEPESPQAIGAFTIIGELPTMIGGLKDGRVTNEIVSLLDGLWTETFPRMPTPRIHSSAVVCQNHLIVAGGSLSERLRGDVLSVVEVMDIGRCQSDQAWSAVSSLLHPLAEASMVVHDEQIFLVGGIDRSGRTLVTQTCVISVLLDTKKQPTPLRNTTSFGTKLKKAFDPTTNSKRDNTSPLWIKIDDSRQFHSTCVSVGGHLLTIGGCSYSGVGVRCVHCYNHHSRLWEEVGFLRAARWLCCAATLPGNELMVVGGYMTLTNSDTILSDKVEISRIVKQSLKH